LAPDKETLFIQYKFSVFGACAGGDGFRSKRVVRANVRRQVWDKKEVNSGCAQAV